ncbi:histidinol-phosphate transaminase [Bacillota bacterium Lsc_1132]
MRWKEQLLSLTPYQPGKSIEEVKKQFNLEKITKLASNENPFGCSKKVLHAIKDYQKSLAIYPDGHASDLREKLASVLGVGQDELIFGNGSDELIQIISRALLGPNTSTVMAAPTFAQYRHNAVIEGAVVKEVQLINGNHDLEGMLAAIDDQTNVVWLCSPNNPTGTYIPEQELVAFLEQVPSDTLVVLDEAYNEYVVADDYYNAIALTRQFENLIVLRTFSKIYGLASLRIGYGIANPAIIRALEPAREPFNLNTFAQWAALTAVEDQEFVQQCKKVNRQGLNQFYQFCEVNNLFYYPSQGNFILIDFKVDADEVFQFLLEKGFIVRSGKGLGFPTSVRITVGSTEQNEGVLNAIKMFLTKEIVK